MKTLPKLLNWCHFSDCGVFWLSECVSLMVLQEYTSLIFIHKGEKHECHCYGSDYLT